MKLYNNAVLDAYKIVVDTINDEQFSERSLAEEMDLEFVTENDRWQFILKHIENEYVAKVIELVKDECAQDEPLYVRDFLCLAGEVFYILRNNRSGKEIETVESIKRKIEEMAGGEVRAWVNVYHVIRQYGGPEEGGWYYNLMSLVDSEEVNYEKVNETVELMKHRYGEGDETDVYGVRVEILVEGFRGQSTDTEPRIYQ